MAAPSIASGADVLHQGSLLLRLGHSTELSKSTGEEGSLSSALEQDK